MKLGLGIVYCLDLIFFSNKYCLLHFSSPLSPPLLIRGVSVRLSRHNYMKG